MSLGHVIKGAFGKLYNLSRMTCCLCKMTTSTYFNHVSFKRGSTCGWTCFPRV